MSRQLTASIGNVSSGSSSRPSGTFVVSPGGTRVVVFQSSLDQKYVEYYRSCQESVSLGGDMLEYPNSLYFFKHIPTAKLMRNFGVCHRTLRDQWLKRLSDAGVRMNPKKRIEPLVVDGKYIKSGFSRSMYQQGIRNGGFRNEEFAQLLTHPMPVAGVRRASVISYPAMDISTPIEVGPRPTDFVGLVDDVLPAEISELLESTLSGVQGNVDLLDPDWMEELLDDDVGEHGNVPLERFAVYYPVERSVVLPDATSLLPLMTGELNMMTPIMDYDFRSAIMGSLGILSGVMIY